LNCEKGIVFAILAIALVSISITTISAQSVEIPQWIKNNVKWWTDGSIDDSAFVSGIEFLISEGIIDVPITQKTVSPTDEIPSWVRTNAKWWADGSISDSDFVKGIEFLVNSGIISVKQTTQTQIDPLTMDIDAGPSDDTVDITQESWLCSGDARCFTGIVTSVIDGDTIKVDGKSIRFAMASSPELNEPGGIEARNFIETICSVGSIATVDEDDGQTQGSYGRILGVVYCNGFNLNADLLDVGHGYLITNFCRNSEFANDYWAQKHGCSTISEPKCPADYPYLWSDGLCYQVPEFLDNGCPRNYPHLWSDGLCYNLPEPVYEESARSCDSSYPDFCIPPPPPDLDCDDIGAKDFTVYYPDPHGFDRDNDGIGCES
jgi:micrococcal nuclease